MYRDLSHPIEQGMPTYPGDPGVRVEPAASHEAEGYSVHELHLGSHSGTHVDAPSHTEPDGATLDDARDVGDWVFDARLLDLAPCEPREGIGPGAFPEDIDPAIDLLVVRTGWADHWGTEQYRDHPYLTPAFVGHCVDARLGVALDTFGPDPTPPTPQTPPAEPEGADCGGREPAGVPAHHSLLGADLPIVENLTNLAGLPARFNLTALPLPIRGCDGSPVRAVAEW